MDCIEREREMGIGNLGFAERVGSEESDEQGGEGERGEGPWSGRSGDLEIPHI